MVQRNLKYAHYAFHGVSISQRSARAVEPVRSTQDQSTLGYPDPHASSRQLPRTRLSLPICRIPDASPYNYEVPARHNLDDAALQRLRVVDDLKRHLFTISIYCQYV